MKKLTSGSVRAVAFIAEALTNLGFEVIFVKNEIFYIIFSMSEAAI